MYNMKMWHVGCSILLCRNRHHHGSLALPQGESLLGNSLKLVLSQFGDDKTLGTSFPEISRIRINKKENVKDFNQIFISLLNRIHDKPTKLVQIEFYTIALLSLVSMFVKRK